MQCPRAVALLKAHGVPAREGDMTRAFGDPAGERAPERAPQRSAHRCHFGSTGRPGRRGERPSPGPAEPRRRHTSMNLKSQCTEGFSLFCVWKRIEVIWRRLQGICSFAWPPFKKCRTSLSACECDYWLVSSAEFGVASLRRVLSFSVRSLNPSSPRLSVLLPAPPSKYQKWT